MVLSTTPVSSSGIRHSLECIDPSGIEKFIETLGKIFERYDAKKIIVEPGSKDYNTGVIYFENSLPYKIRLQNYSPNKGIARILNAENASLTISKEAFDYRGNHRSDDVISDLQFALVHLAPLISAYEKYNALGIYELQVIDRDGIPNRKDKIGLSLKVTNVSGKKQFEFEVPRNNLDDHFRTVHRKRVLAEYPWYLRHNPGAVFWHSDETLK